MYTQGQVESREEAGVRVLRSGHLVFILNSIGLTDLDVTRHRIEVHRRSTSYPVHSAEFDHSSSEAVDR